MKPENLEDIYGLSPLQQGMLFDTLYAPESGVYFIHLSLELHGKLDLDALKQALQQVINRYSVLRTSYHWEEIEKPLQVVQKRVELPFEQIDWSGLSAEDQQEQLQAFLKSDRKRGFDLGQAPLMRFTIIQTSEDTFRFVWSYHHLILDGWSSSMLLKEIFATYQAICQNQAWKPAPVQSYRNFIGWLQKQNVSAAEAYWRQTLKGYTVASTLSVQETTPALTDAEHQEQQMRLAKEATAGLQTLAKQHKLTLNTLLQGLWALLLSRYTGENDIVFGTVVSGRPPTLPGSDSMIGLFINNLPMRVKVSPDSSLIPWLTEMQESQLQARQYEYASLTQIQAWSDIPRGQPMFETIFVFENYPMDHSATAVSKDLEIRNFAVKERVTFPLSLWLQMPAGSGSELSFRAMYDPSRFRESTVNRMLGHFRMLLESVVSDPNRTLAELPMLTETELQQLMVTWNDTQMDYPADQCLHQLFESQVNRNPNSIAIAFEGETLSYQELNQQANAVAHYLRSLGIGPEVCVGLCMERSLEMVIGLLGILKAGGAYLPLDPAFPADRLSYILADSQAPVLLTQQKLKLADELVKDLSESKPRVVYLDTEWETIMQATRANGISHSDTSVGPDNLAYVIYTSGSTGKPKGVQILHRAVVNFLTSMQEKPGLTPQDILLSVTTLSFDISVLEIFLPLVTGAQVVVAPSEVTYDGSRLMEKIEATGATVMQATPTTWRMLIEAGWQGNDQLKVLCGGEALPLDLAKQILERCGSLWNMYGPTETTIWSTLNQIQPGDEEISIGRPIGNTQCYILDSHLKPVPIGVPGDLYIGGDGLARSYRNRPELTAEKFIHHPFSDRPGARIYKTGDVAKYKPNGDIHYMGRSDNQIKIRGFRVELGEIEAVLAQHPAIREIVVIVREDVPGDKRLVGYPILKEGENEPTSTDLRNFAREQLPEYMVPSAFVFVSEYPLTPNKKIDRKALPAPDQSRPELADQYTPPRDEIEEAITKIFGSVLKLERVGIYDNFFDLGGHSLLATQVISRIRQELEMELPLRTLFEANTPEGLAAVILTKRAEQVDDDKLAALLNELENLSPEEANALLNSNS